MKSITLMLTLVAFAIFAGCEAVEDTGNEASEIVPEQNQDNRMIEIGNESEENDSMITPQANDSVQAINESEKEGIWGTS